MKKKNIDFLATEAGHLGTSPSEFSESISEEHPGAKNFLRIF
jgi:hypothetical protein